ncbi:helix-turn-helix domain-containing protein [Marispirochaeta aestuarii]|uniref:helix-turn-helix transcriptional regulator n=1 Tax=Marispirochaeta aestuarii TaxID=1963862 RepID=UPI0029C6F9BD|nr:helix-turn-helix domain-containing protein [Marispirochaeta aestuarii]
MPYSSGQSEVPPQLFYGDEADVSCPADPLKRIPLPLPEEIGDGTASFTSVSSDLGYGTLSIPESASSSRIVVRASDAFMKLTLHLSSSPSIFSVDGIPGRIEVRRWDGFLLSGPAYGVIDINTGEQLEEFSLFITENLFWRLGNELQIPWTMEMRKRIENLSSDRAFLPAPTNTYSRLAVFQLLHCPLCGSLLRLYMEAKLMEIFSLRVYELLQPERTKALQLKISASDRRHLEEAMEILVREAFDPPCIRELAGRVGLNTTKLKQGFRIQYGTTIFSYVRQLRMERARELLLDRALTVGEVALAVGYSSFSSFSKAFYRYHGFLPKTLVGHRKK